MRAERIRSLFCKLSSTSVRLRVREHGNWFRKCPPKRRQHLANDIINIPMPSIPYTMAPKIEHFETAVREAGNRQ